LSGIELVRSKCSASVGSSNGAAVVQHLTSGECADALSANPELKSQYNIDGIVDLIKKWNFKTATFSGATNSAIGIDKLSELGLVLNMNNPDQDLVRVAYNPAVQVQQETKVASAEADAEGNEFPDAQEEATGKTDISLLGGPSRD